MDEKKLAGLTLEKKRAIIVKEDDTSLSVRQQCELLGLNRSTLYYEAVPWNDDDLKLMNAIDVAFTARPHLGVGQMTDRMRDKEFAVGPKRIRRLMRHMGLFPIFPTRNTSKRNHEHKVFPYLLRDLAITRVNQVWSMDITYVRLKYGFAYLSAVMDWHSRYVIAWRISNTLTSDFCIECLKDALQYGRPEIFNTDQGCQFTSEDFIKVLQSNGIAISMDGRGRALDNIFVERLWRSVKYENIYIKGYQMIPELHAGMTEYFDDYNMDRRHSSLQKRTPWMIFSGLEVIGSTMVARR